MMSNDKMIKFVKRWREIETAQRELDYEKATWCRDLRAEFSAGAAGDKQFSKWLEVELGLTGGQASELLARAAAIAAVPDEKTWNNLGGFKKLRDVVELPRTQQVQVLEAAKSTGKAVGTVIRERGLRPQPVVEKPTPINPAARAATTDAKILAEYIRANCDGVPKNIARIVERYIGAAKAAA